MTYEEALNKFRSLVYTAIGSWEFNGTTRDNIEQSYALVSGYFYGDMEQLDCIYDIIRKRNEGRYADINSYELMELWDSVKKIYANYKDLMYDYGLIWCGCEAYLEACDIFKYISNMDGSIIDHKSDDTLRLRKMFLNLSIISKLESDIPGIVLCDRTEYKEYIFNEGWKKQPRFSVARFGDYRLAIVRIGNTCSEEIVNSYGEYVRLTNKLAIKVIHIKTDLSKGVYTYSGIKRLFKSGDKA